MHRLGDRKPSPVDRSSTAAYETPGGKPRDSKETQQTVAPSTVSENNSSGQMLLRRVDPLFREESMPEGASVLSSNPSSFATPASPGELSQLDEIWEKDLTKVALPEYVKANSTTITFPEKLMLMLIHIERVFAESGKKAEEAPIAWAMEGRAFIIRSKEVLVQTWLPEFFRHGKFQSFTRKLYRWGFRQVNLPRDSAQEKRELVFANPHFQRDKRGLMARMRSVTAAGLRRQHQQEQGWNESKMAEKEVLPPSQGLLGLGTSSLRQPNFVDSLLSNQTSQALRDPAPLTLPNLSLGSLGANQNRQAILDPLTRQLLLSQLHREREPSLADLLQQQPRIPQQLRLPSTSAFNFPSSGSFGLHQNLQNQNRAAPSPLQSLLDAATPPTQGQGIFSRDTALQERLRELAEQFLRGNRPSGSPP